MDIFKRNIAWPRIIQWLTFPEAVALSHTCTDMHECVSVYYRNGITCTTPHTCSTATLRALRKQYTWNRTWTLHTHIGDGSLAALKGAIDSLTLVDCKALTDAGLAHLAGIHTLTILPNRPGASQISKLTDAGLAHLRGIHTLIMKTHAAYVTDAGIAHLAGIHTLDFRFSRKITDASLAHLAGIHTLIARGFAHFTDAGLAHLAGIHTLSLHAINHYGEASITDAGLAHLQGIHTLTLDWTVGYRSWTLVENAPPPITWAGLLQLKGLQELKVECDCPIERAHHIFSWENPLTHMTPAERMTHYRDVHGLRV